jgi:hypothetical protein
LEEANELDDKPQQSIQKRAEDIPERNNISPDNHTTFHHREACQKSSPKKKTLETIWTRLEWYEAPTSNANTSNPKKPSMTTRWIRSKRYEAPS